MSKKPAKLSPDIAEVAFPRNAVGEWAHPRPWGALVTRAFARCLRLNSRTLFVTRERGSMAAMRAKRDQAVVDRRLSELRDAARTDANLMPFILDCARAYCTLYEIRAALEDVFGAYREPVFF